VQRYGGDTHATWEQYIAELEALPPDFAVLGINDYLFLEGYKKLLGYKAAGRLKNIHTLLPVVEFRLDKFAGTEGNLRRVNYHVIFSNELTADIIEQQFLNQLKAKYTLSSGLAANITWGGVVTRESIEDLGRKIIESVPDSRKGEYGPPIEEGFRNLNLTLDTLRTALDSPYLATHYLTAVGKTEWASLKWNDQSIAEKKSLINGVDLVFVAANNPDDYQKARAALNTNGVNAHLLDCSDAHSWSADKDKDRIGQCDTWIKADPTFRGLQHALLEFEDRVYVGSLPPKLSDLRNQPRKYICSVAAAKKPGAQVPERWFDCDLTLNPGLVAIIGNKGSGKSALADIIALGGHSSQQDNFSFLNAKKFRRSRDNKSEHFTGTLRWCSGDSVQFSLSQTADTTELERVKYIPQSHLERLCNELAADGGGAFDQELREVIFSHISAADRLGQPSLDALLNYLGEGVEERMAELRADLARLNKDIANIEEQLAPEHKKELEKRLTARLRDLNTHKANKPVEVPKPDADPATKQTLDALQPQIGQQRSSIAALEQSIEKARQSRKTVMTRIATVDKMLERLANLEARYKDTEKESAADLQELGLRFSDLAELKVENSPLRALRTSLVAEESAAKNQLDPSKGNSEVARLAKAKDDLVALQNQLDAPTRRYQEYLTALKQWEDAAVRIQDDAEDSESIAKLREELRRISTLPAERERLTTERMSICRGLFAKLEERKEQFSRLYQPVLEFITRHDTLAESINLSFDVRISEFGFIEAVTGWVHQGRSGSFQGSEEGTTRLKSLLERHTFDTVEGVEAFLTDFMQLLHLDSRSTSPRTMSTKAQLKAGRTVAEFYDYLFGLAYLRPRYALKMDGKELSELSPGERGLLLLLFYLLVEKSELPLLMDQPEENLDNETVHDVLVPSIKLAKQRRQIIIVTHNPNLAVVSDADQVIAASIDKQNGCAVTYESGALESPVVNKHVVRYLEGTLPAFMNRDSKYIRG
jgi:ABC-type lipoprotein export system ATPase subunit/septal ring factor EnvC (AmiA/AmiB activator)